MVLEMRGAALGQIRPSLVNSLSSNPTFSVDNRCFGLVSEGQLIDGAWVPRTWNPPE